MKMLMKKLRERVAENQYWNGFDGRPVSNVRIWFYAAYCLLLQEPYSAWLCEMFGHRIEMEDFVAVDYDERGRIVDIDGGGVDWWCARCQQVGGRSWF